ncbi:uracil DNA N-glycosylase Thp1 [Vermiconidia calcicola]|uniref:Uracil DNA N-glycosylase Thp1 n=1 Tax=Vermiconidia calcicola TaxID=1690605 RepID=A0ACC3NWR6_9PEZI|nr:uracil DNA N-glycosylase Thp1 [Vermiconidia calcicola]
MHIRVPLWLFLPGKRLRFVLDLHFVDATIETDMASPTTKEQHVVEELAVDSQGDSNGASNATFKSNLERFKHVTNGEPERKAESPLNMSRTLRATRKRSFREADEDNGGKKQPSSPSPAKTRRQSSRYAPPSKYAHLPKLTDILEPNLIAVFVGTNPGVRTATAGHAYAHPSNLFWRLLHSSGCTDERLKPEQDVDLPRLYSLGNTNIVERPSKDAAELSKQEMAAGTPILEAKISSFRPEAVCIVGKGIWEAIWRWRHKREIRKDEFRYGWQDDRERMGKSEEWDGAPVFVTTSTSGLSASTRPAEKEAIWRPFGQFASRRREERQAAGKAAVVDDGDG